MKDKNKKVANFLNKVGDKTIKVIIETKKPHPKYHKYVKHSKKYLVHFDSEDELVPGDTVEIVGVRPISKNKCFKYVSKVKEG